MGRPVHEKREREREQVGGSAETETETETDRRTDRQTDREVQPRPRCEISGCRYHSMHANITYISLSHLLSSLSFSLSPSLSLLLSLSISLSPSLSQTQRLGGGHVRAPGSQRRTRQTAHWRRSSPSTDASTPLWTPLLPQLLAEETLSD